MVDENYPSPDPARWPTAEEWVAWFHRQNGDRQLAIAEAVIRDTQQASECFITGHCQLPLSRRRRQRTG